MNETTDATAIFAPLWKRKWLILAVGILVATATYVYYKHKPSVFGASTTLYLGSGSEAQLRLGNSQQSSSSPSQNSLYLADQAQLINSSLVGEAVLLRLLKEHTRVARVAAAGSAQASSTTDSDFIAISTKAHSPQAAAKLANTYAQVYLDQQNASYLHVANTTLASQRKQLKATRKIPGPTSQIQAQTLDEHISQLESDLAAGGNGYKQINPAVAGGLPLSPEPKRNAIFGFALGILLAAIVAYAFSRFDRRLRSLADIEAAFAMQILTALPKIRRPVVSRDGGELAPAQSLREPLRRLHTTLQLWDTPERDERSAPRSILFVSPDAGDGKSTLIADLALVQREAGERVVIVEADLRRPVQAKLLGIDGAHGLTEVLAGKLDISEAMQIVQSVSPAMTNSNSTGSTEGVATAVQSHPSGTLSVLVSGGIVANPPALLEGRTVAGLLRTVAEDYNYVLIDAPPPLVVSDVIPLLHMVDAIVIVARVGHTREASAQRLVKLLGQASSAPVLGIVANAVSSADLRAYGFSSAYSEQRGRRSLIGR
jgi:Mrp family chromosome partitioning ATPase/capsular polysaccharide biosynthesis protein